MTAMAQEISPPRAPPPERLRPVRSIKWANHSLTIPEFAKKPVKNDTAARKAGRRYEDKVQDYLLTRYSKQYVASPWLQFKDPTVPGFSSWCQPDGWLIDMERGLITIVEIKLSHTAAAWWQIRHLYEPVTRFLFGKEWRYAACEVTRLHDPSVAFPETVTLTPDVSTLWSGAFGVHSWRG